MEVCPLILEPILKPKIWGGRKLGEVLGKRLPDLNERYGESWECVDLEVGQSVVARGPAVGKTLHELVKRWGAALLGRAEPVDGRFPLLIKFLDAAENLSIQVHPDPAAATRLGGSVRVKHEAWYVLEAGPAACIYRGLKSGMRIEELREAVAVQPAAIMDFVERIAVRPGHAYFIPSGTVHALGAGVLVSEIQTPSDVTYRLFDWNRTRPPADAGLHVDQGLACIRTDVDFTAFEQRSHVTSLFTTVTRLVACPSFVMEKVRFMEGVEQEIPYAEMVCWVVLEGEGEIMYGRNERLSFGRGELVILPAGLRDGRLRTHRDCTWLEVTIPTESDLRSFPRPERERLGQPAGGGGGLLQLRIDRRQNQGKYPNDTRGLDVVQE